MNKLPLPVFYNPEKVGEFFTPNIDVAVSDGLYKRKNGLISGVDRDTASRWSALVSIDNQSSFVLPGFELLVPGAVEDTQRTVEIMYKRPDLIDEIVFTQDLHYRLSIFFPSWWEDKNGNHPEPFTDITADDVLQKRWMPVIMETWSIHYVTTLRKIKIWPYHCLNGTKGASIVPAFEEMMWWFAAARDTKPISIIKGTALESEFFGGFQSNVQIPGHPHGGLNTDALNLLGRYERTFWVGQAGNICVLETLRQYIEYYKGRPEVLKRIYLIMDCMSVVGPNGTEDQFIHDLDELAELGVNLVKSDEVLNMAA